MVTRCHRRNVFDISSLCARKRNFDISNSKTRKTGRNGRTLRSKFVGMPSLRSQRLQRLLDHDVVTRLGNKDAVHGVREGLQKMENDQRSSYDIICNRLQLHRYIHILWEKNEKRPLILFVGGLRFKIATPTGPASYERCLCSPRSSVTKKHWPLAWH